MKKLYFILLIILIFVLLISITLYINYSNEREERYIRTIKSSRYMAHALGGIDGENYTNSKEALESSYNKGIRLFEVDINLTADDKLVCVHGWNKNDYEKKLGLEV